jgi:hypothetical protein
VNVYAPLSATPLSTEEAEDLKKQLFAAARRMSNEQVLDLADSLHDIIRARAAIRRTHGIERASFAAES